MKDSSVSGLTLIVIRENYNFSACHSSLAQAIPYGARVEGIFRLGSDIDLKLKGEYTDQERLNLHGDIHDLCFS